MPQGGVLPQRAGLLPQGGRRAGEAGGRRTRSAALGPTNGETAQAFADAAVAQFLAVSASVDRYGLPPSGHVKGIGDSLIGPQPLVTPPPTAANS